MISISPVNNASEPSGGGDVLNASIIGFDMNTRNGGLMVVGDMVTSLGQDAGVYMHLAVACAYRPGLPAASDPETLWHNRRLVVVDLHPTRFEAAFDLEPRMYDGLGVVDL